jgi:anti-sigma B factor antagonist
VNATSEYLVAQLGTTIFVRSRGLANMKNAPMLSAFFDNAIEQGVRVICVDLSCCTGMDSTFMGLLVGCAQTLTSLSGKLVVVNPSDNNFKLLSMLGVTEVLPVVAQTDPAELHFVTIPGNPAMSSLERMELIKRAHENLLALNASNQAKFTQFLRALEGDLQKLRSKSSAG